MGLKFQPDIAVIAPLATSFIVFSGIGIYNKYFAKKPIDAEVEKLMIELS